ncbi:hypothetical protein ABZ619_39150 [Streptomyces sp. NPDC007851]|uniref:hypothetical protein n=1 Tax=Streptomyces sp. NPDC007851 TaxID=3155008 RepID=UPI0033CAF311
MTLALAVMLPLAPYRPTRRDIGCRTKVPFPTRSQAKKHWKWLRKQPGRRHLEIYECRYCPGFHVGNPPGHQTYLRAGSPYVNGHHGHYTAA